MSSNSEVAIHELSRRFLERYPAEASARLERLSADQVVAVLEVQSDSVLALLLQRLSLHQAREVAVGLSSEKLASFLEGVDPSYAARLIAALDQSSRERCLGLVSTRLASELRELMSYPRDTAGSIMESRFLALRSQATVEDTLRVLRSASERPREQVFVVDLDDRLLGRVALADLAVALPTQRMRDLLKPVAAEIRAVGTREEVLDLLRESRLTSLPVVDTERRLLGVIRQEALIAATQDEALADLQSMVGVSREERALSKPLFAVRKRLPWLQINLLTAFLAAAVVGLFEDTIARVTALAVLLPVVAGQSGNTGAQALAVTMRGLALREVRPRQWLRILWKETRVGFANGVAVALTTSGFVYLWSRSLPLAMVIGISMVMSMTIAGLAGGAIPLILVSLRQDPAQSSSIFLTTVTDVAGFFSFLGIATLFASHL